MTMQSMCERTAALESAAHDLAQKKRYLELRLGLWRGIVCALLLVGLIVIPLRGLKAQGNQQGLAQRVADLENAVATLQQTLQDFSTTATGDVVISPPAGDIHLAPEGGKVIINPADLVLDSGSNLIIQGGGTLTVNGANLPSQITDNAGDISDLQAADVSQNANINANADKLAHFSRVGNDVFVTGANLHIRNGAGTTSSENGMGNLIVGYNELRGFGNDRTGSHNAVVGMLNNYARFGGLVVGANNESRSEWAVAIGGANNLASGPGASVTGGRNNTASNFYASVTGGNGNSASGIDSSVNGGDGNTASGQLAWASGGQNNEASNNLASVSGGQGNMASGQYASVSGGINNTAQGMYSLVSSGGGENIAAGANSTISGGGSNQANGNGSTVGGGIHNVANGNNSTVSGGQGVVANTDSGWVAGKPGNAFQTNGEANP